MFQDQESVLIERHYYQWVESGKKEELSVFLVDGQHWIDFSKMRMISAYDKDNFSDINRG